MSDAQELLREIQSQHATATKAQGKVRSQITLRERDAKMLDITLREVESVKKTKADKGEEAAVYRSVGKMFMKEPLPSLVSSIKSEAKEAKDDVESLKKKQKYLENEVSQANRAFREILMQQQRAAAS